MVREVEDESLSEAADHDPSFDWIGCPKCGIPINITVPVKDHGYELLAYVHDMLDVVSAAEAKSVIAEMLPWVGMDINAAHRRNPEFWPFIAAQERGEQLQRQKARESPKRTRQGKAKDQPAQGAARSRSRANEGQGP